MNVSFAKIVSCTAAAALTLCMLTSCTADNNTGTVTQTTVPATTGGTQSNEISANQNSVSLSGEFTDRDFKTDYDDSAATKIALNGTGAQIDGTGAKSADGVITISEEGTYVISGTLSDGRIAVDAGDSDKIQIVLDNADISCSDYSPFTIINADKVFITLKDGTVNTLSDKGAYTKTADDDNTDAVIFSKADLTINGGGTLNINAACAHGIVSKDDLKITGGIFNITSADNGISGKDCLAVAAGTFNITAGGDGMKSSNDDDTSCGNVYIENGEINITAEFDGIQASGTLTIAGGTYNIITGGGSKNSSSASSQGTNPWGMWGNTTSTDDTSDSAKAIKAAGDIKISGGTFTIDSSDDSVHTNTNAYISGGTFTLNSGDDGMHADSVLEISGGTVNISKSYEGLEGNTVNITGGTIAITASDDGINAAGGSDSSSLGGRPGQNGFSGGNSSINISGGYISVNADGDGIDANGSVNISGGVTLVSGPTDNGNTALDYDGTAVITGGILIAAGSSGMVEGLSSDSTQYSLNYTFTSAQSANTSVALTSDDGTLICSFTPQKQYQNVIISAPEMTKDEKVTIVTGAEITGADANGFASGGNVSGGNSTAEISLSSVTTSGGASSGMGSPAGGGNKRPF